jgi:hypothetical protein
VGKETHGGERGEKQPDRDRAAGEEAWLRCAACGHGITRERARIDVDGAHVHTFVNPQGVEFVIRCFRDAPGCAGWGDESTFWSWFPGTAWRVALCAGCGAHVGWSYRYGAPAAHAFWGLISARVV